MPDRKGRALGWKGLHWRRETVLCAVVATFCLIACVISPVRGQDQLPPESPFFDAHLVPDSVESYVGVVDAGRILDRLMSSPLQKGLEAAYVGTHLGKYWIELSGQTGIAPRDLFDQLLSVRAVFVTAPSPRRIEDPDPTTRAHRDERVGDRGHGRPIRPSEAGPDRRRNEVPTRAGRSRSRRAVERRWVLISTVSPADARNLIQSLGGQVSEWVGSTALYSARDDSLRIAYVDGRLYLGATRHEALFRQLITRRFERSLAEDPEFRAARLAGPGQIGYFARSARHEAGAWSAGIMRIKEAGIRLHLVTHSAHDQDVEAGTNAKLDRSLIAELIEGAVGVSVDYFGESSGLPFSASNVIRPLLQNDAAVFDLLGPSSFTVVAAVSSGKTDGINADGLDDDVPAPIDETDRLEPAICWGIQAGDPQRVAREMDRIVIDSVRNLFLMGNDDADGPQLAVADRADPTSLRRIRVAVQQHSGYLLWSATPSEVELFWSTVQRGSQSWWICSTNRTLHDRVAGQLASSRPALSSFPHVSRGVLIGGRCAGLLEKLPGVSETATGPLHSRLYALCELIRPVQRLRWMSRRTSPTSGESFIILRW